MTAQPEVSHGRGGAGNINPDATEYVDGGITRQGVEGPHGDGAFSTGRGGGGNIGDAGTPPAPVRADKDVIPEAAVRASLDSNHHTGRGGAANVQLTGADAKATTASSGGKVLDGHPESTPGGATHHISLADKLKHKLFGKK
ncbi:uncharacterized protein B0I36DRAFT_364579 [Microdochium trichocladiopsis]|uniref:Uncharacterized protein n=1 Tax=Microdochium trichocladiopsis TaxID=1682393 RepID=A0A9P9BNG6_9PEZI|nr:uncharacterized protein B0I36DRAFT_364579 [Microdochium trichocladiopsis]KAH7027369.1 hypothetical protein B0I36DRAFT_364579 [Microdochium trichocladiopsis]